MLGTGFTTERGTGSFGSRIPPLANGTGFPRIPSSPNASNVVVSPRSRQTAQIPSQMPQAPSYVPGMNNGPLNDAQSAERQYLSTRFNDWYNQRQRDLAPTPIPSAVGIGPSLNPSPSVQIPPQSGALRMTNAAGQTFNGNPIPPAPQSGPPSPMIPPQSAAQLPSYQQLTPNEQHFTQNTSAIGTLRGSFQAHDANGNAIPGQYNTVDASAPRDLANLQANARANARISPEFNQTLQSDKGFQQAQQRVADVKAADAAKMPLSLYQQHQQALANPPTQEQQDLAALSPKDRLNYERQQKVDRERTEQTKAASAQKDAQLKAQQANEDRKFKLAQDKQTFAALGSAGKFVIDAAKQMGDWWNKKGQVAAQNAKTQDAKVKADREFHLQFEKQVTSVWDQMTKKNPKLTSADYDKMRRELETRVYGAPQSSEPTKTPTIADAAGREINLFPHGDTSSKYTHTATGPNGEKVGWNGSAWESLQ